MHRIISIALLAALLAACAKQEEAKPKASPAVLVTVAQAETRDLEILETTVGTLEGLIDPTVGAEVAGRVVQVLAHAGQHVARGQLIAVLDAQDYALQRREAQAEVQRIEALLANQERVVERNRRLVERNFISQNALDDAATEREALVQQLEGARARFATIAHNDAKTRVLAPLDGQVETQVVSVGDYVKVGDPLFQVVGTQRLRAHLPFPESAATRLEPGQAVRLTTPAAPGDEVTGAIKEIKPVIDSASRAVDVIADVTARPGWRAGASVNGAVVIGWRAQAVVVPEQSVVLRPAGEVVYAVRDGKASQRIVEVGLRQDGWVEVLRGLAAGETVAVDGAGYLTDQAAVTVQSARP